MRIVAVATILAVSFLCLTPAARAADEPQPGDSRLHPVTSIQADTELARAEHLIGGGQVQDALVLLQDIIDKYGNTPVRDGERYVPLAETVSRRICALPEERRQTYETLYGPAAHRLYERGVDKMDLAMLRLAARRYYCTASAAKALSALASAEMDEGRYDAALADLSALQAHPSSPVPAQATAAKTLTCLVALGRMDQADRLVADLKARGITELQLAGRQWKTEDYAHALLAEFASGPSRPSPVRDCTTSAGGATGAGMGGALRLDALLPETASLPPEKERTPAEAFPAAVFPVVGGDMVFVKRAGEVFGLQTGPGGTLSLKWHFDDTAGEAERKSTGPLHTGEEAFESLPQFAPIESPHHWKLYQNHGQAALALADGRLYSVDTDFSKLLFPVRSVDARMEKVLVTNALRCFDARTGQVLWQLGPQRGLQSPGGASGEQSRWFFTSPTVADGRAYVLALTRGTTLTALCLDAATGQVVWQSDVGLLSDIRDLFQFAFEFFLFDTGPPSVSGGVVIFPTGQGIVAAFDAASGDLLWLAPYPVSRINLAGKERPFTVPVSLWAPRQPVIAGGSCVVGPPDSEYLIALDMATGKTLWKRRFETSGSLLGADQRRVYVQGEKVSCLDLQSGEQVWGTERRFFASGRAALGRDVIYVPTLGGIERIETSTGKLLSPLPSPERGVAGAPAGPVAGNAVVLDEGPVGPALLLASRAAVTLYPSEDKALARVQQALEQNPKSWRACVERGAALMEFGHAERALPDMEKALELAEAARAGPDDLEGAKAVAEVKRDLAVCHARAAVERADPPGIERAKALAGDDPQALREVATARIRLLLRNPKALDIAAAFVTSCQEVGDRQACTELGTASAWLEFAELLRERAASDADFRKALDASFRKLIEARGAAADAGPAAMAAGEFLARLAWWAPLEEHRALALLKAGQVWRRAGKEAQARRAFLGVLEQYPNSEAASGALTGLVENLEAQNQHAVARDYMLLYGGSVGARDWVDKKLREQPYAALPPRSALPSHALTHVPRNQVLWRASGLMLSPAGACPPDLDRFTVLLNDNSVRCVDCKTGEALWETPAEGIGLVAQHSSLSADVFTHLLLQYPEVRYAGGAAVLALPHGFCAFDFRTGQERWRGPNAFIGRTAKQDQDAAPPAMGAPTDSWALGALAACRTSAAGEASAFDTWTGDVLLQWRAPEGVNAAGAVPIVRGPALFLVLPDEREVMAFNLSSAKEMARWKLSAIPKFSDIRASDDGCLFVLDTSVMHAMDLTSLRPLCTAELADGFRYLVSAGRSLVVFVNLMQTVTAMEPATGKRLWSAGWPAGERRYPTWGTTQNGIGYYLDAWTFPEHLRRPLAPWFTAGALGMSAVRSADRTLLWHADLPQALWFAAPPTDAGSLWVLRLEGPRGRHVIGIDKQSGKTVFRQDREAADSPLRAVPAGAVIRDDIVVLPFGDEVVASGPGEQPLPPTEAPQQK